VASACFNTMKEVDAFVTEAFAPEENDIES